MSYRVAVMAVQILAVPTLAVLAVVASTGSAPAQGVRQDRNVSMDMASQIMTAAMERCSHDGYQVSVAVVDRAGQMVAFLRGDGSAPHTAELARRKAYTARTFRRPSAEWAKRSEEPAFAPQRSLADVIALGGGLPINVGDDTIGAVGVSGAPGQEKDEACAKAGLAKVADQLK
jgi:uncharacterized protein GlcG (DUF336 family)